MSWSEIKEQNSWCTVRISGQRLHTEKDLSLIGGEQRVEIKCQGTSNTGGDKDESSCREESFSSSFIRSSSRFLSHFYFLLLLVVFPLLLSSSPPLLSSSPPLLLLSSSLSPPLLPEVFSLLLIHKLFILLRQLFTSSCSLLFHLQRFPLLLPLRASPPQLSC
ncbi:unnamed protein product [Pleuronectes platessa]|uniref:Uncharacterized protein n=1 Tax=Pleuronectes platessa TaxID=8262 RepID=A0A9N7YMR9_PLEPL|nr:unnamed protein product [Pleuronectes platessa]